jgi:hypothetical protein
MLAWGWQVWLQQWAWTEGQKPERLAERAEKIRDPVSAAFLAQEPMFCFETALKALYWSTLVYRYDENAPDLTRDPMLPVRLQKHEQKAWPAMILGITRGGCRCRGHHPVGLVF